MKRLEKAASGKFGDTLSVSSPVRGEILTIGNGFKARSFKHSKFAGLMDPLVLVDHFVMSKPTFGEHPHAGMSAVSVLFEDSVGVFNNQDSLGNKLDLQPGDLYWLKAGKGVTHNEQPVAEGVTHGLQIFVNLPGDCKKDAPKALHAPSKDMPVIQSPDFRIRVVMGASNDVIGPQSPSFPLTILDAFLNAHAAYSHKVQGDQAIWVYVLTGKASFSIVEQTFELKEGEAQAVHVDSPQCELSLHSESGAHVVMLQGEPIREQFVQRGPFVMSKASDLDAIISAYENGRLGSIKSAQAI